MDKNILSPYIRRAMHSVLPADCTINRRIIQDYEIIYVQKGSCRIRVRDEDYICGKNTVVFLRPGTSHSFHVSGEDFVQPHIHFDAVYDENSSKRMISFKDFCDMTEEERSVVCDDIFKDTDIPVAFVPEDSAEFSSVFFNVIDIFQKEQADFQLLCKIEMLKLLMIIAKQFETGQDTPHNTLSSRIGIVKNYIDGNFPNGLNLDLLAQYFHMNKFTMMRQFKNAYGINIARYCNIKKLEKARELLCETSLTIKTIGEILGFTDAYSFSRFFKNEMGISPLGYRKKNS